jgi:Spy/CpxP family protein refolding chaperone
LDKGKVGEKMKRRITLLITALMLAVSMSFGGAAAAFADNPHAGHSGKFKGSAKPCKQGNAQKCPPHGGS